MHFCSFFHSCTKGKNIQIADVCLEKTHIIIINITLTLDESTFIIPDILTYFFKKRMATPFESTLKV